MDLLNKDEIGSLIDERGDLCVSMYLPTHRLGPETQQDPIRLKNLLKQAEERLRNNGLRRADADNILGPARRLLNDRVFWQHQGDGLAVFELLAVGGFVKLVADDLQVGRFDL